MDGQKADMVFTDPPYDLIDNYSQNIISVCDGHIFIMNTIGKMFEINNNINEYFSRMFVVDFRIPHLVSNSAPMDRVDFIAEYRTSKVKFNNTKDGFSTLIKCAKIHRRDGGDTTHKQEKKVELPEKFIIHYSNKNNIVADFFTGSGSTLIACEKNNRVFRGIELDPVYCDIIIKRWEQYTGLKAELSV
jgi:DNA modification methylase